MSYQGQQNNYFTSMIHKYNDENFVWKLRPEQIQKSARDRIFKEMIRGQIDYSIYGKYFLDSKFMDNLIVSASDQLNNNTIILNALTFQDTYQPGNIDVINMKSRYSNLVYIYKIILQKLEAAKYSGNIGILSDIQYVLGPLYKNYLN